jgi:hypothetical protein
VITFLGWQVLIVKGEAAYFLDFFLVCPENSRKHYTKEQDKNGKGDHSVNIHPAYFFDIINEFHMLLFIGRRNVLR